MQSEKTPNQKKNRVFSTATIVLDALHVYRTRCRGRGSLSNNKSKAARWNWMATI